jgi:hypothetical protein
MPKKKTPFATRGLEKDLQQLKAHSKTRTPVVEVAKAMKRTEAPAPLGESPLFARTGWLESNQKRTFEIGRVNGREPEKAVFGLALNATDCGRRRNATQCRIAVDGGTRRFRR